MIKKNKRPLTLVEVMIVIAIIGIVAGVIGVKMRDGMEKGRAFKTEIAINKLYEVLIFEEIQTPSQLDFTQLSQRVSQSAFVRDANSVLKDGWGNDFVFVPEQDGKIEFYSRRYFDYCQRKGKQDRYPWDEGTASEHNYPWNDPPTK